MSAIRFSGALLCALVLVATPASATPQQVSIDALVGAWVFETDPHQLTRCVIRGEVAATRAGAGLRIVLHARETCPEGGEWRAEEACTAELARDVLEARCVLVSASANYAADQFSLRVLSASAMSGRLADGANWDSPVRWRRPAPALVS